MQDARTGNADRASLRHRLGRRDRRAAHRGHGDEASVEPSAPMKTRDHITHTIKWLDSKREPQCNPNSAYPDGIDILSPRPAAKRIGSLASSSWSSAKQLRPRHSPFDRRSTLLVCSSPTDADPIHRPAPANRRSAPSLPLAGGRRSCQRCRLHDLRSQARQRRLCSK